MMDFIIVIRGVMVNEYLAIRQDITTQIKDLGLSIPVFAHLPGEESGIEIIWTNPEMELEHLSMINKCISEKQAINE